MVIVLTDGGENKSRRFSQNAIRDLVYKKQLAGNWTFVFQVPPGYGASVASQFGVPRDNIREWETTREGLIETSVATRSGMKDYFTARAAGATAVQSFYVRPDLSDLKASAVQRNLSNLRSQFQVLPVLREVEIRPFVEDELGSYRPGSAYYQLTKTEKVQASKDVLLMEKGKSAIYGGREARQMIGLPDGYEAKVEPGNHANYDIFVQSTSVNRKLVRGTKLLVQR